MSKLNDGDAHAAGDSARSFLCPGEPVPVTRAVHLGRLNAAWAGCDHCDWRFHTEGLSERVRLDIEAVREHRPPGVMRSEYGIRGQWLNELDSQRLALSGALFCRTLAAGEQAAGRDTAAMRSSRAGVAGGTILTGFDHRSFSPEVYSIVTRAAAGSGMSVIDCGRCTHASLLYRLRRSERACGAIHVTGAGQRMSWTGLDVFDPAGESAAVNWETAEIRLQQVSSAGRTAVADGWEMVSAESEMAERLREFRGRQRSEEPDATGHAAVFPERRALLLQFPGDMLPVIEQLRCGRTSGTHSVVEIESDYRTWLRQWFPSQSRTTLRIHSSDPLVRERAIWLGEVTAGAVRCGSRRDGSDEPVNSGLALFISEDDRWGTFVDAGGAGVPVERIVRQLVPYLADRRRHMSVHYDTPSQRIWLSDLTGPGSAGQRSEICDVLAVAGLMLDSTVTRQTFR